MNYSIRKQALDHHSPGSLARRSGSLRNQGLPHEAVPIAGAAACWICLGWLVGSSHQLSPMVNHSRLISWLMVDNNRKTRGAMQPKWVGQQRTVKRFVNVGMNEMEPIFHRH